MTTSKNTANKSKLWLYASVFSSLAAILVIVLINAYFLNTTDSFFKNRSLLVIVTLMSLVSAFLSFIATFMVHGPKQKSVTFLCTVFSIGLSLYAYLQASWDATGW